MPKTRSRKLTVVLAAGALTMFGAAGALAADEVPGGAGGTSPSARPMNHGGGHGPGADEGNPLCRPPMAGLPVCRADSEPDPPSEGPGADPANPGDGGGSGSPS